MCRFQHKTWYRILVVVLSVLVVVNSSPMLPALAETILPVVEQELVRTEGVLRESVKIDETHTYDVSISYGEDANIPSDAKLCVSIPIDGDAKVVEERTARLTNALELQESDRVLTTAYLNISIEAAGTLVVPATNVDVTIQTNSIDPSQSAAVEAVMLNDVETQTSIGIVQSFADECLALQNLTEDDAHVTSTKLAFSTQRLGTLALTTVATRQDVWSNAGFDSFGLNLFLWTPRHNVSVVVEDATAPELDEGKELLACYAFAADPCSAYGTALWIEANATETVSAYCIRNGVKQNQLFGTEGTQDLVSLNVKDDQLLLVHTVANDAAAPVVDTTTPEASTTTPEASTTTPASPEENTASEANEIVSPNDTSAVDVNPSGGQNDREEGQQNGSSEPTTSADSDTESSADESSIIESNQPEEASRKTRSLMSANSTRALSAASSTNSESTTTALSSTFNIKAVANVYARTTVVTFVDENKTPIKGTVIGTHTVTYTGTGSESNETNTIDMYSYVDKLDPQIADEYDFSRVYVQLTATNQKDYRYIQVSDGTAIDPAGSATTYRAYLYMNSIEENKAGHDYNGTWYQLSNGGNIDNMYIEYYHVAEASFYALDTRGDPVQGAEFALYTDENCYVPLEYKNEEITATSNKRGLVSFGKIPQGTYYMKETVVPESYKKTTTIHTVVVDGETPIANIIHQDDDGSVIIADVLKMTLKKEWDDTANHDNDSVQVTVYCKNDITAEVTLNKANNWTYVLEDLNPNDPYMVSETGVEQNGVDATSSWIPHINYEEKDPHVEYYKADEFRKDKEYVLVTTTANGSRALDGGTSLTTTPIEVDENGNQLAGEVADSQLWSVDSITKDGIIALKNEASARYLDRGSSWTLNTSYPVPLYVRHINDSGKIKLYHRANLNNATSNYLYVWYSKGNRAEGAVDNWANNESKAAVFDLYRKVNVRSVDVTITNKATSYPVKMKNVTYPKASALPGMTFDLYTQDQYDATDTQSPLLSSLTSGTDGFLQDAQGNAVFNLSAGTYLLVQTGDLQNEGYAPLTMPVRFTITRGGALKVIQSDQEFKDFAYSSVVSEGEQTYPLLQIPNNKPVTVEITLDIEGDYADLTREFPFELRIPDDISTVTASIDGVGTTFTEDNYSFTLKHGQSLRLIDISSGESFVLVQTSDSVASVKQEGDGLYETRAQAKVSSSTTGTVTIAVDENDARILTLSNIEGTESAPARMTITNELSNSKVLATGVLDNTDLWSAVVAVSFCVIAAILVQTRRRIA